MSSKPSLQSQYPWVHKDTPLITSAPMRIISGPELACAVSLAGGIGFLGAGTDPSATLPLLSASRTILSSSSSTLQIGIGYLLFQIPDESLISTILPALIAHPPSAIWLYAPRGSTPSEWLQQLTFWTSTLRSHLPHTELWLQIGSIHELKYYIPVLPIDVLVVQASDAGGHGLVASAGLLTLLPEVVAYLQTIPLEKRPYVVAAGGIAVPSQLLAVSVLGAAGVSLGTAFLPCPEANVARGYRTAVLRSEDGGQTTVRSSVYDYLRGTRGWPERYGGRGVVNASFRDWTEGAMDVAENAELYRLAEERSREDEAVWSVESGRMTAYAGTGVGLVREGRPAVEVVMGLRQGYLELIGGLLNDKVIKNV